MKVKDLYHTLYEAYEKFPSGEITLKVNGVYYNLDEVNFTRQGFSGKNNGLILHGSLPHDKRKKIV